MKINVNIFLGMIGSGKTSLINSLLQDRKKESGSILIIQDEFGTIKINPKLNNIKVIEHKSNIVLSKEFLIENVQKSNISEIFIECNIMKNIDCFMNMFEDEEIKSLLQINNVYFTLDCKTGDMYLKNMGSLITTPLYYAEKVILNNSSSVSKESLKNIIHNIKSINNKAKIIKDGEDNLKINEHYISGRNKISNIFYNIVIILLLTLLISMIFSLFVKDRINIENLNVFLYKFLGVVIESIPFIFLGALVSSFIQIFISTDKLFNIIPKNNILACIMASIIGVFIPVCDCGTIPLARGFMKKGLPFSAVITFILSAPIVNPIAIASTAFVFKDTKSIVILRILIGIIVSIVAGLIMGRANPSKVIIGDSYGCDCILCTDINVKNKGFIGKIKTLFIMASDEFFNIGKFIIIGAFLSSLLQAILSANSITAYSVSKLSSLLIVIPLAIIFSICSTSDAFISKGFINELPLNSILGFLVLGPMISLKNTMMLLGSFKKRFVILLQLVVSLLSILLISFIAI